MLPELCLGTVQMGLDYGITNLKGRINNDEVIKILDFASRNNINFLDTAQSYGSSEFVIGKCSSQNSNFRIISKMSPQFNNSYEGDLEIEWENIFFESLRNLNVRFIDSFLLHQSDNLIHPEGKRLLHWLQSLKQRGLVKRIGVSIYSEQELDRLPLSDLQIIQLPLSLYDQRLIKSGTIDSLNKKGIAVHVRSIFLQGLILNPASKWPKFLSSEFINHHNNLNKLIKTNGMSLLEIALGFIKSCKNIEAVVFGVTTLKELKDIYKIWNNLNYKNEFFSQESFNKWAWENIKDIDPRTWKNS